jgi:hypothetical protein
MGDRFTLWHLRAAAPREMAATVRDPTGWELLLKLAQEDDDLATRAALKSPEARAPAKNPG